jgi:phosphatidylserine decarboxylase
MSQLGDRAFIALQHILPKHWMSRVVYRVMRSETPWLRKRALSMFLSGYKVNMDEAVESNPYAYKTFNAFFTRALKQEARQIATATEALVSPVDGTVSQCGTITEDSILQAKGQNYSLLELLGGNCQRAKKYLGGSFACIYLAPYNYHRIHMPLRGVVRETIYIPGDLYIVNAATARHVPRLFARNERVVCDFSAADAKGCDFAMVFVGALHVGSIETVWNGEINPLPRGRQVVELSEGKGTLLAKGAEAGRFNMGSTVILILPPQRAIFDSKLQAGATVQMGERIGTIT